jgi:hypothetical protein
MEKQTTVVRRPIGLWVLVGLYSSMILLSFGTAIYMRFWSSYSDRLQAQHADRTLLDYAIQYHPGILVLVGCLGLVMLRRWAAYVFGILLALRLREFVAALFRDEMANAPAFLIWPSHIMSLSLATIAFSYSLYLWKKGTLRKGM